MRRGVPFGLFAVGGRDKTGESVELAVEIRQVAETAGKGDI